MLSELHSACGCVRGGCAREGKGRQETCVGWPRGARPCASSTAGTPSGHARPVPRDHAASQYHARSRPSVPHRVSVPRE
eukprot:2150995-Rhodomonas_salina.1